MRRLPLDHPGSPDHRSAGRLLWWLARGQWHTLVLGMTFGIVWMSAQAVLPAVIGLAIDRGVAAKDLGELGRYERSLAAVLEGRTVIAIAHRLFSAHDADRVPVVEDGCLAELGTHDELVAAGGSYAALWESWSGGGIPG